MANALKLAVKTAKRMPERPRSGALITRSRRPPLFAHSFS